MRRRQMFRLVGLYIVGAWLIIQVADIAFPAWGIPDTALRYLFYAAFLCFPIAFILGWFFDIRKDGIYRTSKAGADETVETSLQRTDYAILTALLAVGLAVLLGSVDRIQEETESSPAISKTIERPDNSIAVLPFVNRHESGYGVLLRWRHRRNPDSPLDPGRTARPRQNLIVCIPEYRRRSRAHQ